MSVTLIKWNRNGLCGAACAHMALHAQGVSGATQGDAPEQEAIWTSIKAHTNGNSRRQCTNKIFEPFPNMIREACGTGNKVVCWETFPTPLKATLITLIGSGAKVTLRKTKNETTANNHIKKCLKRGGIPIVLVSKGTHWVVVDGWDENVPEPVSFLDPAGSTPSVATLLDWGDFYMAAPDCGALDGKHVVVEVDP